MAYSWNNPYAAGQEDTSDRTLSKTGSLTDSQPCLAEHPVIRTLPPVRGILAFPMPASEKGPLVQRPMRFCDVHVDDIDDPLKNACVDAFQLGLALAQDHLIGTPPIKTSLVLDDVNSMEDLHRKMFVCVGKDDKIKIKYGEVEPRNYMAPEMAHSGATFFKPVVANKLKQLYEGENAMNMPMPMDIRDQEAAFASALADRQIDFLFDGERQRSQEENESDNSSSSSEDDEDEDESHMMGLPETLDDVARQFVPVAPPQRQEPHQQQQPGPQRDPYQDECDKVTGILVRLHEEETPKKCAGFILYLLVHDPMWNPGTGIEDLIQISRHTNQSERRANSFRSTTPHAYMARQMQVAALDSTHILYKFSRESYSLMAACYNPDAHEGRPQFSHPFSSEDHPLHPFRIFTPDRALNVVRAFNSRIDLSDLERYSPELLARLPAASPLFPYHQPLQSHVLHARIARHCWALPHRQLLWRHESKIGMAFQFLPWEDGHLEVSTRDFDPVTGRRICISSRSEKEEEEHRRREACVASGGVLNDAADPRKQREQTMQHLARKSLPSSFMTHQIPKEHLNWFYAAQGRFGLLRDRVTERRPPLPAFIKRGRDPQGPAFSRHYHASAIRNMLQHWLVEKHTPHCELSDSMDRELLDFFSARLWTTEAIQPAAIRAIIYWQKHGGGMIEGKHMGNGEPGFTHITERLHFSDARLDLGANFLLVRAAHMRELDRASPQVMPHILLLSFASYDRHDATPGMKINVIPHGEKSTGKSFMSDCTIKYSIQGSIENRSSESKRANNFVTDYSDALFMFDELSPDWKKNVNDGEKSAEFKEASVAGKVTRYVAAHKGKDGNGLTQLAIVTYYNTMWYLNSNIPINMLEDAVRSRTLTIVFMDYGNDGRLSDVRGNSGGGQRSHSILDYMLHDSEKEVQKTEREYKQERWVEHAVTAMFFKAVESRALPEIDMRVCRYTVYRMLAVYRDHGVSTGSVRNYTRIERLASKITAVQAQKYAFCNPHDHCTVDEAYGESFKARGRFTTEALLRMKPYLVCSMQTAVFAFSMLADQYLDPLMGFVFEGMLRLVDYPVKEQHDFLRRQEERASRHDRIPAIEGYRSYALMHYITNSSNRERAIWRRSGTDGEFLNLDYVRISGSSISDLANHLVAKLMPKPAKEDIESVLYDMTRMAVELPSHEEVTAHGFEDHLPEVRRRKVRIMEQSFEGSHQGIYICPAAVLALSKRALLEKAVRSLAYGGMQTPRTFLLNGEGCGEVDRQQPNFSTITITSEDCTKPGVSRSFKIASASYMERRDRIGIFASRFFDVDGTVNGENRAVNLGVANRHHQAAAHARARARARFEMNADEHDRSTDDQVEGEAGREERGNGNHDDDDDVTEEDAELPYYNAMQHRLGLSHTKKEIKIEQDLDEWAVTNYFAEQGIPMCLNPDDEQDLTLYWKYTTASGQVVRRPLPTPHAMHAEAMRQVRTDERYRRLYNSQYRGERARQLAPLEMDSPLRPVMPAHARTRTSELRHHRGSRMPVEESDNGEEDQLDGDEDILLIDNADSDEEDEEGRLMTEEAANNINISVSSSSDSVDEHEDSHVRDLRKRKRAQERFLPAKEARLQSNRLASYRREHLLQQEQHQQ